MCKSDKEEKGERKRKMKNGGHGREERGSCEIGQEIEIAEKGGGIVR